MTKRNLLTALNTAALTLLPTIALAATPFEQAQENLQSAGGAAFGSEALERSLPQIIGSIIQVFLTIVGVIFLVLMVYAGYLWMTAQGEESKIDKAKDTIKAAVIGLIVVVAAYAITNFIVSGIIGASTGTSGPSQF